MHVRITIHPHEGQAHGSLAFTLCHPVCHRAHMQEVQEKPGRERGGKSPVNREPTRTRPEGPAVPLGTGGHRHAQGPQEASGDTDRSTQCYISKHRKCVQHMMVLCTWHREHIPTVTVLHPQHRERGPMGASAAFPAQTARPDGCQLTKPAPGSSERA